MVPGARFAPFVPRNSRSPWQHDARFGVNGQIPSLGLCGTVNCLKLRGMDGYQSRASEPQGTIIGPWTKKWTLTAEPHERTAVSFHRNHPNSLTGFDSHGSTFETPVILLGIQARGFRQQSYFSAEGCAPMQSRQSFSAITDEGWSSSGAALIGDR